MDPAGFLRQRVLPGDEPGLSVPDELRSRHRRAEARYRAELRVHPPTTYTCNLKPDLKFANGHDLTSSDVKFSFDRENTINDPNGPQSLLANLGSVETPDPRR